MGAKCRLCSKDMLEADGCIGRFYIHNGKRYEALKVGEDDFCSGMDESTRCGDCGAKMGHYHHSECDIETCPICGLQRLSCDCGD